MMKIIIVMKDCEFSLDVAFQEPILEVKGKIQNYLGIPVSSQILSVCDWELIDGLDLSDYPLISEGTKIALFIKHIPPALEPNNNQIKVTVKFSTRKLEVSVDKYDTIKSLKEKIHIVDGTPIKRMTLFFCGLEMDDDFRNLSEYGIQECSEIIVFLKTTTRIMVEPPENILGVIIQTSSCLLNAAKIPVETSDASRVEEVRHMLLERRILPVDEYIFIHKQRIMREDCSLRWHGVENGDYIYVFKGSVTRSGGY
ncbi:polyubiquitin [Primulina tabacum]|uniref:polyubiquitin n=1 Tax=Primulina tabacum TaxID=48773 RepID=UPI003F59DE42